MLSGEYDKLEHAGYRLMPDIAREHLPRRFRLTFDNFKRHGAYPVETHTSFGCEFPDKTVAINTNDFGRKGFESIREMRAVMGTYGNVLVDYID